MEKIKYVLQPWLYDEEDDDTHLGDAEYEASNVDSCIRFVESQTDDIRKQLYNWEITKMAYSELYEQWENVIAYNLEVAKEYL